MKLTKQTVETMCSLSGVRAERRETVDGFDVFVSDGFSPIPEFTFKRFGVEPGEFNFGAYCTIWWVARGEERFDVGMPMLFDAFHNPELDLASKKLARINAALNDAKTFIAQRRRIAAEEPHVVH